MEYEDFPRSNKALLAEVATREQHIIEILDLVKEHHQVAVATLSYRQGLAMTELEIKLRHTIDILEHIYDKYGVESSGYFGFYRDQVESAHDGRGDMDSKRLTGDVDEPPLEDGAIHP